MPEKRTHDHVRHGTTSLLAAFNTADGTVISSTHRQHRTIEFKKFLTKIDGQVPVELDVHLICDNYGTHKSPAIKKWLSTHPRFHVHYTPTYFSWINQVERWFAYLTDVLLRRSDHRSVQVLEKDIRAWVSAWNDNPKPFVWTKTAEQILDSLGRLAKRINGADTSSAAHNNAAPIARGLTRCALFGGRSVARNDLPSGAGQTVAVDMRAIFVKSVERRWFVIARLPITRDGVIGPAAGHIFP